jgi:hypothetical protein
MCSRITDGDIAEQMMREFAGSQFQLVETYDHATIALVKEGNCRSLKTVQGFSPEQDPDAFFTKEGETGPIPINLWKFELPVCLPWPDKEFISYITKLGEHLGKDCSLWDQEVFCTWIEFMWSGYGIQMKIYLLWSAIPLVANFILCFYIVHTADLEQEKDDFDTAKICSMVSLVSVAVMNLYEIMQAFSQGIGNYFNFAKSKYNYYDLTTQLAAEFTSVYLLNISGPDDLLRTFVSVTLLLQSIKFYKNLEAVDFVRKFANKLIMVISELVSFFIVILIFLLCFTNVFYIMEFYYESPTKNDDGTMSPGNNTWPMY